MRAVLQDVRYALRRARSRAGFTAIAVLSIGLGVGVNTAAFSLVNAIVLRKTPIARADRVAELDMANDHGISGPLSYADVKELREQSNGVFSQIGLAKFTAFTRDLGDHVETLTGELVNGDFFPLIGIPPVVGRLLGPEDDVANAKTIVVDERVAAMAFPNESAIGKSLRRPLNKLSEIEEEYGLDLVFHGSILSAGWRHAHECDADRDQEERDGWISSHAVMKQTNTVPDDRRPPAFSRRPTVPILFVGQSRAPEIGR